MDIKALVAAITRSPPKFDWNDVAGASRKSGEELAFASGCLCARVSVPGEEPVLSFIEGSELRERFYDKTLVGSWWLWPTTVRHKYDEILSACNAGTHFFPCLVDYCGLFDVCAACTLLPTAISHYQGRTLSIDDDAKVAPSQSPREK